MTVILKVTVYRNNGSILTPLEKVGHADWRHNQVVPGVDIQRV